MTNRSNAQARKTFEGWIGEFRPAWKATYDVVQNRDRHGNFAGPRIFATEAEAECEAWRVLRDLSEPLMVGTGTMIGKSRAAAEALFKEGASA